MLYRYMIGPKAVWCSNKLVCSHVPDIITIKYNFAYWLTKQSNKMNKLTVDHALKYIADQPCWHQTSKQQVLQCTVGQKDPL